ncbi:hypothetical protein AB0H76_15030 [Nocardia sp. NPDC050712]|uniref:hypothetical protein n=1 Tax=Nocardia sp. NPDC050712 TaxID=3155518 RepID=UPI0033C18572
MKQYLYRVRITAYPKGAFRPDAKCVKTCTVCPVEDICHLINRDWKPEGWAPAPEWVERYGKDTGDAFFWPSTEREYRARSSARRLKRLIESYGATAIIQRSAPIVWPADGEEKVS